MKFYSSLARAEGDQPNPVLIFARPWSPAISPGRTERKAWTRGSRPRIRAIDPKKRKGSGRGWYFRLWSPKKTGNLLSNQPNQQQREGYGPLCFCSSCSILPSILNPTAYGSLADSFLVESDVSDVTGPYTWVTADDTRRTVNSGCPAPLGASGRRSNSGGKQQSA